MTVAAASIVTQLTGLDGRSLCALYERRKAVDSSWSERKMADFLSVPFNALHGLMWRWKEKVKRRERIRKQKRKVINFMDANPNGKFPTKVMVWDIETSGLRASTDQVLCACFLDLESNVPRVFRYDDYEHEPGPHVDRGVVQAIIDQIRECIMLIGHYHINFDFPFIRTRAMHHGLDIPHFPIAYDTLRAAQHIRLLTGRRKLAWLVDFLGIPQEKTAIYPCEWSWALHNTPKGKEVMRYIVEHCQKDVLMTRAVYARLFPEDDRKSLPRFR